MFLTGTRIDPVSAPAALVRLAPQRSDGRAARQNPFLAKFKIKNRLLILFNYYF